MVSEVEPREKTFRITLDDIPSHVYRGIDFSEIRKISKDSIHYEIKANVIKEGDERTGSSSKINALTNEYKQYVENQELEEKDIILDLGIGYIEKIEAREEGK